MKRGPCEEHAVTGPCPNCGVEQQLDKLRARAEAAEVRVAKLKAALRIVVSDFGMNRESDDDYYLNDAEGVARAALKGDEAK